MRPDLIQAFYPVFPSIDNMVETLLKNVTFQYRVRLYWCSQVERVLKAIHGLAVCWVKELRYFLPIDHSLGCTQDQNVTLLSDNLGHIGDANNFHVPNCSLAEGSR